MSYALEQRLRFIDFLLFTYGYISRKAIMDYYGIGEATATRDFKKYKELAPKNMVCDIGDKSYIKSIHFKRYFK